MPRKIEQIQVVRRLIKICDIFKLSTRAVHCPHCDSCLLEKPKSGCKHNSNNPVWVSLTSRCEDHCRVLQFPPSGACEWEKLWTEAKPKPNKQARVPEGGVGGEKCFCFSRIKMMVDTCHHKASCTSISWGLNWSSRGRVMCQPKIFQIKYYKFCLPTTFH